MSHYLHAMNDAIRWASLRMSWYNDTGEVRYLEEAMEWINVANIYRKEIEPYEVSQSGN